MDDYVHWVLVGMVIISGVWGVHGKLKKWSFLYNVTRRRIFYTDLCKATKNHSTKSRIRPRTHFLLLLLNETVYKATSRCYWVEAVVAYNQKHLTSATSSNSLLITWASRQAWAQGEATSRASLQVQGPLIRGASR